MRSCKSMLKGSLNTWDYENANLYNHAPDVRSEFSNFLRNTVVKP